MYLWWKGSPARRPSKPDVGAALLMARANQSTSSASTAAVNSQRWSYLASLGFIKREVPVVGAVAAFGASAPTAALQTEGPGGLPRWEEARTGRPASAARSTSSSAQPTVSSSPSGSTTTASKTIDAVDGASSPQPPKQVPPMVGGKLISAPLPLIPQVRRTEWVYPTAIPGNLRESLGDAAAPSFPLFDGVGTSTQQPVGTLATPANAANIGVGATSAPGDSAPSSAANPNVQPVAAQSNVAASPPSAPSTTPPNGHPVTAQGTEVATSSTPDSATPPTAEGSAAQSSPSGTSSPGPSSAPPPHIGASSNGGWGGWSNLRPPPSMAELVDRTGSRRKPRTTRPGPSPLSQSVVAEPEYPVLGLADATSANSSELEALRSPPPTPPPKDSASTALRRAGGNRRPPSQVLVSGRPISRPIPRPGTAFEAGSDLRPFRLAPAPPGLRPLRLSAGLPPPSRAASPAPSSTSGQGVVAKVTAVWRGFFPRRDRGDDNQ